MIEKINDCENEEELLSILENERNKEILEAASQKMELLNNKNK